MASGKSLDFAKRHRVHWPFGRRWSLPKGHKQQSASCPVLVRPRPGSSTGAVVSSANNRSDRRNRSRMGEDAGAFLDQFLTALPVTMNETLGPRIADLRPRWAIGTSRLVARLLAKHIDDFAERDISLVLGR